MDLRASLVHLVHRELLAQWVKKARGDNVVTLAQLVFLVQWEKEVLQVIGVSQVRMGYPVQKVLKVSVV